MLRRLFTLVSAVSLLLCVTVCVLWVRSYPPDGGRNGQPDSLTLTRSEPLYWFVSYPGSLLFCRQVGRNWDHDLTEYRLLGVQFGGHWGGDGSLLWNLEVPYWVLAAAAGMPPLLGLGRWRARRRARRSARLGLCPACGYDLRATPGRCPECGAVPAPGTA